MKSDSGIIIFDGECEFCKAWLAWLHKGLTIESHSYHLYSIEKYGLTQEECSRAVYVVTESRIYSGASAIAYLLKARGNVFISLWIKILGPLGRAGYRWVAAHRNSLLIRSFTRLLNYLN